MPTIHLLSGGAAQGLVKALEPDFARAYGCDIQGEFGAVGMMKEKLLRGEKCDLVILSQTLIDELAADGHVVSGSTRAIGVVHTGIAVRDADAAVDVGDADALRRALRNAKAVYFPDPEKATAGIHFMGVLKKLGLDQELADRLRPHPNGATAMREMASAGTGVIGCTQVSEIVSTPGVRLVAPLPPEFALATTYTAAVASRAAEPGQAVRLIDFLTRPEALPVRRNAGIE